MKFINKIKENKNAKKIDLVKDRKLEEQNDLIEYLKEQNDLQQEEIRELIEEKNELEKKLLSSDLEINKAKNEISDHISKNELLEDRVEYLEDAIEQYQNMPNLKNMIDNLSSLTTPSIDKLVEVMKSSNFDNLSSIEEKLNEIEEEIISNRRDTVGRIDMLARDLYDGRRCRF